MWTRRSKIAGWLILLAYMATTPLVFEPAWLGVYVAIFVGVSTAYVYVAQPVWTYVRARLQGAAPGHGSEALPHFPHPKNEWFARSVLRRPIRELLLVPGEDGLFFVPLLLVGVTWWTALVAALLFGLAHTRNFSREQASVKAVCTYLACLLVLPHGVLHVVVGHVLLDAIALVGVALMVRAADEPPLANTPLEPTGAASSAVNAPAAQRER